MRPEEKNAVYEALASGLCYAQDWELVENNGYKGGSLTRNIREIERALRIMEDSLND